MDRPIKYLKNQEKKWKKIRNRFGYNNNRIAKRKRRKEIEIDWKGRKSKRKTLNAKDNLEGKDGDKI